MVLTDFLKGIADAIRSKEGSSGDIPAQQFASRILALEGEEPTYETPSISVSSSGVITATANGKSATQNLSTQAAKTVTPGTSQQTAVASGKYTTGAVTVKGDSNLTAGNIKSGVSIFGVAGSYAGSGIPAADLYANQVILTIKNNSSHTVQLGYMQLDPSASMHKIFRGAHDVPAKQTVDIYVWPLDYISVIAEAFVAVYANNYMSVEFSESTSTKTKAFITNTKAGTITIE